VVDVIAGQMSWNDVADEFPLLVTNLSPYYNRRSHRKEIRHVYAGIFRSGGRLPG
jgi:hypothetical protein